MHFIWLFLLALAAAAPPRILTPSDDSWYQAPDDFESKKNGEVLRIRKAPSVPRSIYFPITVKNTWQIMVKSEDSHGNASWTVTSLLEPFNADNSKLVSYQIAEDSSSYDCAPSYAIMYGGSMATVSSQVEMFAVATLLEQGYWINIPDYQGQTAAFTAGRLAGKGVLDSIRGVLNSAKDTGINEDPDIIVWGYSGGSLASGWAAALQPKYAPSLGKNLKGFALGGFVTNITETVVVSDGGWLTGLIPSGITGLAHEYPQLEKYIKVETGNKTDEFMGARKQCMGPALAYWFKTPFMTSEDDAVPYFKNGYGLLENDEVKEVLADVTLGLKDDEMPEAPIWVYHGSLDEVVPHVNTERVYDIWCKKGIKSFEFTTDMTGGHITDMFIGIPAAIGWIEKRFGGLPVVDGCSKNSTLSMLTHPYADPIFSQFVSASGSALFGGALGPNGENITKADLESLSQKGRLSDDTLNKVKRDELVSEFQFVKRDEKGWLWGL